MPWARIIPMCAGSARDSPDFKKEFPKDITIPVARLQELVYRNTMRFRFSLCLLLLATGFCQGAPDPLKSLENCRFVPTPWADGDSFLIRTKEGEEMTVRLYGADCIEFHVTDGFLACFSLRRRVRKKLGLTDPYLRLDPPIRRRRSPGKALIGENHGARITPSSLSLKFKV